MSKLFLFRKSLRLDSVFHINANMKNPICTCCPQIFHAGEGTIVRIKAAERNLAAGSFRIAVVPDEVSWNRSPVAAFQLFVANHTMAKVVLFLSSKEDYVSENKI